MIYWKRSRQQRLTGGPQQVDLRAESRVAVAVSAIPRRPEEVPLIDLKEIFGERLGKSAPGMPLDREECDA